MHQVNGNHCKYAPNGRSEIKITIHSFLPPMIVHEQHFTLKNKIYKLIMSRSYYAFYNYSRNIYKKKMINP